MISVGQVVTAVELAEANRRRERTLSRIIAGILLAALVASTVLYALGLQRWAYLALLLGLGVELPTIWRGIR